MTYQLYFEYVALLITGIIIILQTFYKDFPTRINKIYMTFVFIEFTSVLLDIISCWALTVLTEKQIVLNYTINILYNLTLHTLPCIYYTFSVAMTHEQQDFKIHHVLLIALPLAFNYISILTTPLTHFVFYFDENNIYQHHLGMTLIYVVEVMYVLILSPYEIIHNYKKLSNKQRAAVILYTIVAVAATGYQFLNPYTLTIGLGIALSLFIVRLTIRNYMEYVDPETEAFNHNALQEYFFTASSTKRQLSIGVIHITNKDVINKQFGVESSEKILKEFLKCLKKVTREENFFFLFQDTFIFVNKNKNVVKARLNQIIAADSDFKDLAATVEFKCYMLEELQDAVNKTTNKIEVDRIIDIISFAIAEPCHNRSERRNIKVIDKSDIDEFDRLYHISQKVKKAIDEDSFEVYLQPIYNLHTDTYTSAESLIRLRDDDGKFISPDDFIPACERNGQILQIGDISMRKTCEFINSGKLQELGITKVNINLSTVQCMQSNIVEHLFSILDSYKIPYDLIRFEITESFLENDSDTLLNVMNSFCEYGIEFALDDYGTGFSNVSRLITLPFSEIKFDKSIVYAAMENQRNEVILSHLMGMVKASTLKILAEGVETEKLLELLKRLGADYIQGWYFSKALPLDEFVKEVSEKNSKN